ncbi:MAG: cation-transporting P-type ATPase [Ignavibacteria bacterium]|nr:cation-transporting P-type ATPase [Ignavibacteria bacterium]
MLSYLSVQPLWSRLKMNSTHSPGLCQTRVRSCVLCEHEPPLQKRLRLSSRHRSHRQQSLAHCDLLMIMQHLSLEPPKLFALQHIRCGSPCTMHWLQKTCCIIAALSLPAHRVMTTHVVHTEPLCWVVLNDTLRHDAQSTIAMFHAMNITTHLLTGDKQDTAEAVVQQLGTPSSAMSIHARCTPQDKYEIVDDLCSRGHVIMIGDGINDIPALRRADVGVAPSQSSSATKLVADIVLEQGGFADFPAMINEGRTAVRTVLTVSTMFLVKNALLVLLTLGSWLAAFPYVLSPRRGALLSIIGIVVPSICASWWPQRGVAATRFFAELWQTMIVGTLGVMLSYVITTQLFLSHEHFTIIAVFSLLSSLLTIFVLDSHTFMVGYVAVSVASLVIVSLLMIIPASLPILSLVQLFYEIGGAGTSAVLPLLICAALSIAVTSIIVDSLRWVVLPRFHRS